MTILLSAKNLTTRLRVGDQIATVVDGLTFDLHSGKTLALVGESGCGKSMTALSLMRILPHPPALDHGNQPGHSFLVRRSLGA